MKVVRLLLILSMLGLFMLALPQDASAQKPRGVACGVLAGHVERSCPERPSCFGHCTAYLAPGVCDDSIIKGLCKLVSDDCDLLFEEVEGIIGNYAVSCDDMLAGDISLKIADYSESCDAAGTEFLSSEFSAAGAGCYCPSTMDLLMIMFEGGTAEEVKRAISAFASCTTCDEIINYAEAVMVFDFAINQYGDLEILDCNAAELLVCSHARMGNCAQANYYINIYSEIGCDRDVLYGAYQPCVR